MAIPPNAIFVHAFCFFWTRGHDLSFHMFSCGFYQNFYSIFIHYLPSYICCRIKALDAKRYYMRASWLWLTSMDAGARPIKRQGTTSWRPLKSGPMENAGTVICCLNPCWCMPRQCHLVPSCLIEGVVSVSLWLFKNSMTKRISLNSDIVIWIEKKIDRKEDLVDTETWLLNMLHSLTSPRDMIARSISVDRNTRS